MSELHLDSLEIKNFRCFEHLTIEKLGRVNLIVGKNSVGKTALLEAIWLLKTNACWSVIHKILYDRNELVRYRSKDDAAASTANIMEEQEQMEAIKTFFIGRPPKTYENIKAFAENLPPLTDALVCSFASSTEKLGFALSRLSGNMFLYAKNDKPNAVHKELLFQSRSLPPLPEKELLDYRVIGESKHFKTVFIPLAGLTWKATCTYWDDIALTDKEEAIISFLKIIDPLSKRFTFKGENMENRVRYAVIKTDRFDEPLPLANMGEGIQRSFAMALAMSTASDGHLLVDEFETGLYHRALPDVWRAIFKLAHEWNVQVFATTHSWDCVEAFQQASAEDQNEEAMLIRLARKKNGQIKAVPYTEEELAIAVEENIEVR